MSETQDQPKALDQIIHHLIAALGVASRTQAPDAIRRGITNALLTAQMHDRERVARLEAWLAAEVPGPRAVGERLALVPMVGPTREEQPARIGEDMEAAARAAAGGGGQISSDPVRTNVRPFITAANVARAAGNRRPATLAEAVDQAAAAAACGHPWHVMVMDDREPFHTHCPGGCGATVQSSTIATSVDLCQHPWHSSSTPDHEPIEPTCPACGDHAGGTTPTGPIDAAGIPHKSHYGVNGHPSAADPQVTAIMRQDDGDTREWVGNHTIDCMNRDCTGCA